MPPPKQGEEIERTSLQWAYSPYTPYMFHVMSEALEAKFQVPQLEPLHPKIVNPARKTLSADLSELH